MGLGVCHCHVCPTHHRHLSPYRPRKTQQEELLALLGDLYTMQYTNKWEWDYAPVVRTFLSFFLSFSS